ncbi:MAG: TIGR04283 family arsenosugar biosynthesis glycosyltransferase [Thermodesulfobacteriota bacterium]
MRDNHRISVIIPVLNEEASIGRVISSLPEWVDEIVVVDNGCTDRTPEVAAAAGAHVVREPRRGYGSACLRGIASVGEPDIVVFLDGDFSDHPEEADLLVDPIIAGKAELVIGSRTLGRRQKGALTPQAVFGNWLSCLLIRWIWKVRFTDLGPFRAIRHSTLLRLRMRDRDYGWTVEMQIRAARMGIPAAEVPVSYRPRIGKSKVSGTLKGALAAGTKILYTLGREFLATGGPSSRELLAVFTRYPEPGTTKTRLIPVLGPDGAARLQRRMTEHAIRVARRVRAARGTALEVRFTVPAGTAAEAPSDLGWPREHSTASDGAVGTRVEHGVRFHPPRAPIGTHLTAAEFDISGSYPPFPCPLPRVEEDSQTLSPGGRGKGEGPEMWPPVPDDEICLSAGTREELRAWLGRDMDLVAQGDGDLGGRMMRAFSEGFARGFDRVVVIGSDCPGVSSRIVRSALKALDHKDLVIGPALDGGYYLIGARSVWPSIFEGIPWGSGDVFSTTMEQAARIPLSVEVLEPLQDVDRAEDLAAYERFVHDDQHRVEVSVVIPALNEAGRIAAAIESAHVPVHRSGNRERLGAVTNNHVDLPQRARVPMAEQAGSTHVQTADCAAGAAKNSTVEADSYNKSSRPEKNGNHGITGVSCSPDRLAQGAARGSELGQGELLSTRANLPGVPDCVGSARRLHEAFLCSADAPAMSSANVETIVVDGGSSDATVEIATGFGSRVLVVPGGRAAQMNAGARIASGEVLLFLHGDSVLPVTWIERIREALEDPEVAGGAFEFALDEPVPASSLVEHLVNLRSRLLGMPYGDQGIFVRADAFAKVDGFPNLPIMEDFEFMRRIRRLGELRTVDASVLTSARRWRKLGTLRTILVNQAVIAGYFLGISPHSLKRFYCSGIR